MTHVIEHMHAAIHKATMNILQASLFLALFLPSAAASDRSEVDISSDVRQLQQQMQGLMSHIATLENNDKKQKQELETMEKTHKQELEKVNFRLETMKMNHKEDMKKMHVNEMKQKQEMREVKLRLEAVEKKHKDDMEVLEEVCTHKMEDQDKKYERAMAEVKQSIKSTGNKLPFGNTPEEIAGSDHLYHVPRSQLYPL